MGRVWFLRCSCHFSVCSWQVTEARRGEAPVPAQSAADQLAPVSALTKHHGHTSMPLNDRGNVTFPSCFSAKEGSSSAAGLPKSSAQQSPAPASSEAAEFLSKTTAYQIGITQALLINSRQPRSCQLTGLI